MDEIDFVIPWVDGSDMEWIKERNQYVQIKEDPVEVACRYRDWDNLQYWFRGVEKFAPWVRKIHFVTWGHVPIWLNQAHPKLNVVTHKDYIPEEYLPTYSANPIELNYHRIKGIAEKFVYFNDDMFMIRPMKQAQFFIDGKPRDQASLDYIASRDMTAFYHMILNDTILLNKHFKKSQVIKQNRGKWYHPSYGVRNNMKTLSLGWSKSFPGINLQHTPQAFLKSTYEEVWRVNEEVLAATSARKFRDFQDVNQYLFRYWQLAKGEFVPINREKQARNFSLPAQEQALFKAIKNQAYDMVCANDTENLVNFEATKKGLQQAFEMILPDKSAFEK